MEFFFFVITVTIPVLIIIRVLRPKADVEDEFDDNIVRAAPPRESLNEVVEHGLPAAVTFRNLVIPSRVNTAYTEIDEVIVSPFGIFCVELKSHHGLILGYKNREHWVQYIGGKKYTFFNPLWQNYKHTEALKDLLGSNLRAPIHSYVVFTHASKMNVNSDDVLTSTDSLHKKISNHTRRVYELDTYERILQTLVHASTQSDDLLGTHIQEVKEYLKAKSA